MSIQQQSHFQVKLNYRALSEHTQEIVGLPGVLSNFLWHQDNFQGG